MNDVTEICRPLSYAGPRSFYLGTSDYDERGFPLASSCGSEGIFYSPQHRALYPLFDVYVDGVKMDQVAAWHVGEGWVRRIKVDESGKKYREFDQVASEIIQGTVTLLPR